MKEIQKTKEKTCAFFASDYHFEMISLPYIEKELEKSKEVIILTENDLENTIKNLISKINLNEEKKKKIFNLNWKNDDLNKFKQIKNEVENNKEMTIFIKGKENYIKNINQNIEKWITKNENVKTIDCYDIEEVGEEINEITKRYKTVLSTTGEKKIEK